MSEQELFTRAEWQRLRDLRERFLKSEEGHPSVEYWRTRRDLELYDATFGQRIAWKWNAVLGELAARGRLPRGSRVFDWGCGTGVAARAYMRSLASAATAGDASTLPRVRLWDRSREACDLALVRLLGEHRDRDLDVAVERPGSKGWPDVLLVSHVLDELDDAAFGELTTLARNSRAIIWVEPGSRASSRRLVEVREALRGEFDVLAPCTHRAACGLRESPTAWCHHFTRPPTDVFTSAFWRRFADELGIDLRSVPYSFVVLEKREQPAVPDGALARIVGRPRITKGRARLDTCDESGVRELSFLERTDKQLFKRLDRGIHDPLLSELSVEEQRITAIRERTPPAPRESA